MAQPERFGKYELIRRLGKGGMAEVFLARAQGPAGFEKQVVLKQVLPEHIDKENFRAMFLDEARLAGRLNHPNICQVFELGEVDGRFFLTMEFIDGLTLSQVLGELKTRRQALPLDATMRIVGQVLEALHAAHTLTDEQGQALQVVHRDVTPSNVMVTAQGTVKLLDFGIARMRGRSTETRVGVAKGKLGHMAPEQLRSQPLDARTDVFQTGAVLYQLVLGVAPYADSLAGKDILKDMAKGQFTPPRSISPELSPELEAIILKAMEFKPVDRYQSALEMHAALEGFARSHGLSMGPQAVSGVMASLAAKRGDVIDVGSDDLVLEGNTTTVRGLDTVPDRQAPVQTRSLEVTAERRSSPRSAGWAVAGVTLALVAGVVAALTLQAREELTPGPATSGPLVEARLPTTGGGRGLPPEPAEQQPRDRSPSGSELSMPDASTPDPPTFDPPRIEPRPGEAVTPEKAPSRIGASRPRGWEPPRSGGPTGELAVTCEPSARVRLEGRVMGTCPLTLTLPAGMHRVVLEYAGVAPRTLLVTVVAGEKTPLFDRK